MNKTILVGRLTHDPELKTSSTDKAIAKLRLAVNRPGDDAGTDYFTVVAFGEQGKAQADYLTKGRLVAVEGRLAHSEWTTDTGEYRSKVEVIARTIEWLDGPR